jgi:hypothetical protein
MPSNDYQFITTWHVPGAREEIGEHDLQLTRG